MTLLLGLPTSNVMTSVSYNLEEEGDDDDRETRQLTYLGVLGLVLCSPFSSADEETEEGKRGRSFGGREVVTQK